MRVPLLALLLAAATGRAAPAPGPREPRAAALGPGHVTQVTLEAIYVDRGKRDGVAVGQALPLWRGAQKVATCTVTAVADSSATCTGAGARVGDRIPAERRAPKPVEVFPRMPSHETLEAQWARVAKQSWRLVDSNALAEGFHGGVGVSVAFSHLSSVDLGSRRGATGLERLDVSVSEVALRKDLTLSVDASLLAFSSRSSPNRWPAGALQVLVPRAQVRWRPAGTPWVVLAGRVRPKATPGLGALDGAQGSWRSTEGALEAGVFAGLLPSSALLLPSTSWAVGAFGTTRLVSGLGPSTAMLQADARAGWSSRPNLGTRFEAGVAAHGWLWQRADLHALALLSAGNPAAPSMVDALSFDLGLRPTDRLRLHVDGRYRGNPVLETDLPGVVSPTTKGLHAAVDGRYELNDRVEVGVRVGAALEADQALWAGPEVAVTRLLGGRGVVVAGYEEDFGPARGRSLWAQGTFTPSHRFRFTGRASWAMQRSPSALGGSDVGATLIADLRPVSFGWLRLSATWRTALSFGEGASSSPLRQSLAQLLAQVGVDF